MLRVQRHTDDWNTGEGFPLAQAYPIAGVELARGVVWESGEHSHLVTSSLQALRQFLQEHGRLRWIPLRQDQNAHRKKNNRLM